MLVLVATPRAFAQDSTDKKPAPAQNAAAAPAAPAKKKPAKKSRPVKSPAPLPDAAGDDAPAVETTLIEPSLVYRVGKLWPRAASVYHKPEHGDYFDQIYATLKFQKTWNYVHTVVVEPGFRTKRENPSAWDDAHHFDQAYLESALTDDLLLTTGKKAEYDGSGFMVNPSDLLNENKDILDVVYQKEGVVFSRLKYRLPGDFSLGLAFIPVASASTDQGRALLQFSGEIKQFELRLSATAHAREKATTGLSVQRFWGEHFELHFDGRYQARQRDPAAEGNASIAFSQYHSNDPLVHDDASGFYLTGTRLVLTPRRTIVVEGIQQQAGLLPDDFKRFFGSLREKNATGFTPGTPPTRLQGRHYAFASLQDDDSLKATHLSANYLLNTDDKSSFTVLSVRRTLSPLTSVELSPTFFSGAADTEFGEEPFGQAYYLVFRGRF